MEHEHSMDMDMDKPPFMNMWFHTNLKDTVLFSTWNITTVGTMIWACCLIVVAGILLEMIKYTRRLIQKKQKPAGRRSTYLSRLFSSTHLAQTGLFFVQLAFSYCLMLIFMTFSVWLGLAVVIGLTAGFLVFGGKND